MRYYCTYFDANYLARGLALYESMAAHCQPFHLWVLALCPESKRVLQTLTLDDMTIVGLGEFETDALRAAKERRTWEEYIFTCTASWMQYVFTCHQVDHLSYVDADCRFFSPPEPVFDEIGDAPVAVTPHRWSKSYLHYRVNGIFNVGLVYVRRCEAGLDCVGEWAAQCMEWCYRRNEDGKFCDQGYLDVWPEKWGAHAIQHKGANLAPWNQGEGHYAYGLRDGFVYVDDDPLVMYHFHQGLGTGYPIDPFLRACAYEPYRLALARAEERIARC